MPSSAAVYAARGKLDNSVFKVSFHVQSFPYFHSFILAYFHTFTISPSASHGEFVSSSSSSHLRVPILNGIRRSRRQAFANTTNAVDIDIPMSLQNCPNSLLRSSSMRILNATCAIFISPVCKNSCIVSYFAANCNRATYSLQSPDIKMPAETIGRRLSGGVTGGIVPNIIFGRKGVAF